MSIASQLNEKISKFYESNQYTITIITGRDRGSDGKLTKERFNANNDFEALLYVFENYDLQNSAIADPGLDDEDFAQAELDNRHKIMDAINNGKNLKEALEALKDAYFYAFDISDYYDNIIKLEAPDGHIVFEDDNIDVGDWFEDEDWDEEDSEEDEEEEIEPIDVKPLEDMLKTLPTEIELIDRHDYKDRAAFQLWKKDGEDWFKDFIGNIGACRDNTFHIWLREIGNLPNIYKEGLSLEDVKNLLVDRV